MSFRYAASGLGDSLGLASAEDFTALLAVAVAESRRADLERRTTSVGPHRDEIEIDLDDRDARTRASQGEQRSVALGLRIAAYRVLAERRGTPPVLLLDDVFSELDARAVHDSSSGFPKVRCLSRQRVAKRYRWWANGGELPQER